MEEISRAACLTLGTVASRAAALCLAGLCAAALCAPARADHGRARARRDGAARGTSEEVSPATPVTPIAPPALDPAERGAAGPTVGPGAPRSAFDLAPRGASLAIVARRPGGVLIGDHALALAGAWERDGHWSATSLASGATASFPAPVRVVPSGAVGVLADNVWPAGDVLVAHDGDRALLVSGNGSIARGEPRGHASMLGAASMGTRIVVWWRLDATRTEVEALDAGTARPLWRRTGPAWAWDARLVAGGGGIALLASGEITVLDAASGAPIGRFALGALRSGVGWPHPFALGGGALVVAAPGGVVVIDPPTGAQRALAGPIRALLPSVVVADDHTAFVAQGQDLVAIELASGAARWSVRVADARSLRLLPSALVLCDADGGAILIERASGAAMLRVGVGGCDEARERADGTIAIAGARETWIVGPAPAGTGGPARSVEGVVTLDGAPAAGLPVLIGAASYPLDGSEGCPQLPAYARCVLTDAAGRFRASVRALGLLPVTVDLDAAARRAGRPRATGGAMEIDLDAASARGLRLDVSGADEEL